MAEIDEGEVEVHPADHHGNISEMARIEEGPDTNHPDVTSTYPALEEQTTCRLDDIERRTRTDIAVHKRFRRGVLSIHSGVSGWSERVLRGNSHDPEVTEVTVDDGEKGGA